MCVAPTKQRNMQEQQFDNGHNSGLIGSLVGGVVLGSLVGGVVGALLGKRASSGELPGIDLRELPDRLRNVSESLASRFR